MKVIVFIVLSAVLGRLSLDVLRDRRSHGFYRFIAFECILGLFLANIAYWFDSPFSFPQILSWGFLLGSALLAASGAWLLHSHGQASKTRENESLYHFEKTTRLVTKGVYGCLRHPLYASLLLLAWGIFLKRAGLLTGVLAMVASISLDLTARADERESLAYFGQVYEEYSKRTKRFIPFVY